jgi:predicted DsbA family dithiol-disulfide isomerase
MVYPGEGMTSVPIFMLNKNRLVGTQTYEVIEKVIIPNGIEKD